MVKFHAAKPHHAGPTREEKQTKEEANRARFMLNFERPKFSFGQVKLFWKCIGMKSVNIGLLLLRPKNYKKKVVKFF